MFFHGNCSANKNASKSTYSIDDYLNRIGFEGALDVNLQTLLSLHSKHLATIPFENLDVILGKTISFESGNLYEKLIVNQRGGYCFEQNSLFARVLESVGFSVTPMIARVCWQVPDGLATPLSHMILKVEAEGRSYLSDVGFGGLGLIEPIEFAFGKTQHEDYEPRRLVEKEGHVVQQIFIKNTWQDLYRFEVKLVAPVDLELGNWYSCTHPDARFKQDLVVTMSNDKERVVLNNTTLIIRPHSGDPISSELKSYPELLTVLRELFGLNFSVDTRFECPGLKV